MHTNPVKAALREGKTSLGGWLTLADPLATLWMTRCGFEWLLVEMEHAPIREEM
jgi:2-keto-3-deoxy-L-rhamnonate aldolase RhmA